MKYAYAKSSLRVGIRVLLILGVLAFLAYAFSVKSETFGTTFATGYGTGGIELKIDSHTFYNGVLQPALTWSLKNLKPWCDFFFKFLDVKPGDTGENTISIHIKKNPAWVCLDFLNLKDKENGRNEPEGHEDPNNQGELSTELEFFGWYDDGDNIFELGEEPMFGTTSQSAAEVLKGKSYPIADASTGDGPIEPYETKYIGITWCAGDLTVNLATAVITCDALAMGNEAQTDSMTLDVSFRAVGSKDNSKFMCVKKKVCDKDKGNNGHGNDEDDNDDSNPGGSNDEDDETDEDDVPRGQSGNKDKDDDCEDKGNNGHGNDEDENDDSNPGQSNDENDDTDEDGNPNNNNNHGVTWEITKPSLAASIVSSTLAKLRYKKPSLW